MRKPSYKRLIGSETAPSPTAGSMSTGTEPSTPGYVRHTAHRPPHTQPQAGLPSGINGTLTPSEMRLVANAARTPRSRHAWTALSEPAIDIADRLMAALEQAYPLPDMPWLLRSCGTLATLLRAELPAAPILKKWASYFVEVPRSYLQAAFDAVIRSHPWPTFPLVAEVFQALDSDMDYRRYVTWRGIAINTLRKAHA
jgi:hypothetical protein